MLFNSLAFGFFLPIVFVLYWALPHRYRWPFLLVSSYYFYMSWNPKYVVLILFTTAVSYFSALWMERQQDERNRRSIMIGTVLICLGVLFFFKYFNFFSSSVASLLTALAIPVHPVTLKVLLPVGISFYTFQTLSYVVDVYRRKVPAEHHFGIYATFVSFFPQLVAGPIERTENLLPQIRSQKTFCEKEAVYGLKLMAWGFFKKLAIADVLAQYVDTAYGSLEACTAIDMVMAVAFFTIQIYCDFSGYSDIAIGTARLLGIRLMDNFHSPYFSSSIREFWSRWHISLSTWFRDYVYIPLGGNRCGKWKKDRNLLITFLASGLWHGANWTFLIWGGIHGVAQVIENHLGLNQQCDKKWQRLFKGIATFLFCNIAWVFFRAQSLGEAFTVLRTLLLGWNNGSSFVLRTLQVNTTDLLLLMVAVILLMLYDYFSLKQDVILWVSQRTPVVRYCIYVGLIWLILFCMPLKGTAEFVYFQF